VLVELLHDSCGIMNGRVRINDYYHENQPYKINGYENLFADTLMNSFVGFRHLLT
jgi:hypothetical protein